MAVTVRLLIRARMDLPLSSVYYKAIGNVRNKGAFMNSTAALHVASRTLCPRISVISFKLRWSIRVWVWVNSLLVLSRKWSEPVRFARQPIHFFTSQGNLLSAQYAREIPASTPPAETQLFTSGIRILSIIDCIDGTLLGYGGHLRHRRRWPRLCSWESLLQGRSAGLSTAQLTGKLSPNSTPRRVSISLTYLPDFIPSLASALLISTYAPSPANPTQTESNETSYNAYSCFRTAGASIHYAR